MNVQGNKSWALDVFSKTPIPRAVGYEPPEATIKNKCGNMVTLTNSGFLMEPWVARGRRCWVAHFCQVIRHCQSSHSPC